MAGRPERKFVLQCTDAVLGNLARVSGLRHLELRMSHLRYPATGVHSGIQVRGPVLRAYWVERDLAVYMDGVLPLQIKSGR